jgi:hypothetical protein
MSAATIAKLLKQNALGYIWFDFGDEGWGAFVSKEAEFGNEIDGTFALSSVVPPWCGLRASVQIVIMTRQC